MIDHVVYGALDLDAGVAELERRLGVRAAPGGRHVGRGTHNALLGLGGQTYLEIIARDPTQEAPPALPFGLEALEAPRLVGWALRAGDIETVVERARREGYDPGPVERLSRLRPDGTLLEWRLTMRPPAGPSVVVPFLIDWLDSPHPSQSAPRGVTLVDLGVEHPGPGAVQPVLDALGAGLTVAPGPAPALVAALDTPLGRVVLR